MQRIEALIAAISLVVAVLVAFGIYHLIYTAPKVQIHKEQCPPPVEYKEIMIASKLINTGDTVFDAIVYEKWPQSSLRSGFYIKNQLSEELLKSLIARRVINPGEPITESSVVDRKSRGVLSALLGKGMRAVSINLDQNSGIAALLNPGDIVDVLVTLNNVDKDKEEEANKTVLCGVRILALDQHLSSPVDPAAKKSGDPAQSPKTATLEVTPQQAASLSTALKLGVISLSLHSATEGKNTCVESSLKPLVKPVVKPPEEVKIIRGDGTQSTTTQQAR